MSEQVDLLAADHGADEDKPSGGPISASMIRNHFAELYSEANGYACLFEVANGTGSAARRHADAVVMNLWPSRGMELSGYEFKVSRSDWLHELKQPEKAWPVMRHCDRWFLVAAPGVAKVDEIPANWGFIEFGGKKLRVRKAAPHLTAEPWSRTFLAAMLRRPVRDVEAMVSAAAGKKVAELEARFEAKVQARVSTRVSKADEVLSKVEKIKEQTGIDLTSWTPTEKVVQALRFAMTERPFELFGSGFDSALRNAERAAESLGKLSKALAPFLEKEGS